MALALVLWAVVWALLPRAAHAQVRVFQAPTRIQDQSSQVHLPTDRALARAMSRAQQRLADGEYHEALTFFQEILERQEDSFFDDEGEAANQIGLKATARRLIAELPPDGLGTYELLYGTSARRELDAALAGGDDQAIAAVVRRFFHTSAGHEAALVLAQIEADRGHHRAAAHLYEELLETPAAAARFEPQLSVLAAINWAAANSPELAAETLRSLTSRMPSATVEVAGRSLTTPGPDDNPLEWLSQLIGQPSQPIAVDDNWLTERGDASRNVNRRGGAPHLRARWEARIIADPRVESFLIGRSGQLAQQRVVTLAAASPIAVGDVVLTRTPHNVVAINWRTGKRVWETRPEDVDDDELVSGLTGSEAEDWSELGQPLEQRVWDDALTMSLSSDGERVFAVGGLPLASPDETVGWRLAPMLGGAEAAAPVTNRLAAFELASEGKLVWELDGASTTGELAAAFFLGAPLAVDDSLFIIAEIRSAIYLLALDPETGQLQWQQQLVGLEQGIGLDPLRRLVGAMPSYGGGILVCPTAAGAVVAVDVVRRELAWAYRYPRHFQSPVDQEPTWQPANTYIQRRNDRWLDATTLIADGRVLIASPESAELHCLDLATGRLVWKQNRSDALYVACIEHGLVLLVGRDAVKAIRLEDGSPAWSGLSIAIAEDVLPAGRGYLSDGRYYLPLTSGQVVAVDVARGELVGSATASGGASLGNLICYRGSVISQSALALDKFEQRDVLRQRAETALAKNPDDSIALGELAELSSAEGDVVEAIKLLKRAYRLDPDEPVIREMLAESLTTALAADFVSYRDDLPLLHRLVHSPAQELEVLRIEAKGLQEVGELSAAWKAYLQIADMAMDGMQLEIGPGYAVRSDRWISGRLGALWSKASADERQAMADELAAQRPSLGNPSALRNMRHYLAHFGHLPGADGVRLQLAGQLVNERLWQEAEIALLELGRSANAESQAGAAALMVKLLTESQRRDEARPYIALLADRWKNVAAVDGLTGSEWLRQQGLDLSAEGTQSVDDWPRGRVKAEVESASPRRQDLLDGRYASRRPANLRRLRIEHDFPAPIDSLQWLIASDCSLLVGRDARGGQVVHWDVQHDLVPQRRLNSSDLAQAARLGHLLYVSLGDQLIAVQSHAPDSDDNVALLWQVDAAGRFVAASPVAPVRRSSVYDPRSSRKRYSGPASVPFGAVGPATPQGVVFQQEQQLRCVDPMSGEPLWQRRGIPIACELFGDAELVIVADVEDGTARVFDMTDGRLKGERSLPPLPWLLTAGRNVATVEYLNGEQGRRLSLRIVDVWSGEELFAAQYDAQSRLTVVDPYSIAIVEPTGRFEFIDTRSGAVRVKQQLTVTSQPQSIQVVSSEDQLFVLLDADSRQQRHQHIGADYPLFDGEVHAIDVATGKMLWPAPATIEHRGIALAQPADLPVLIFVDRMMSRDASGTRTQLRLHCIDKQTGQTVYRNDNLPDTTSGLLRISAQRGAKPDVAIEMSSRTVRLAFTDEPRPPEPPANDGVETVRDGGERGLWGVGRRMSDVLRGALESPPESGGSGRTPRTPE